MNFESKKLLVFDLDGTLYLSETAFPEAVEFICKMRKAGKYIAFFTNNASHSAVFHIPKLERLGFQPREEELLTAGDVTADYIVKNRPGKSVYIVGTDELCEDFRKKGITVTDGSYADIVVTSYDASINYDKIAKACLLIRAGAEYFCTHMDYAYPTELGFIPDSGAIAAMFTAATGVTPIFFGKPSSYGMDYLCSKFGVERSETVMFGDRLYTDIAFGKKNGAEAVLLLTGEASRADALALPEDEQPDVIAKSFAELL